MLKIPLGKSLEFPRVGSTCIIPADFLGVNQYCNSQVTNLCNSWYSSRQNTPTDEYYRACQGVSLRKISSLSWPLASRPSIQGRKGGIFYFHRDNCCKPFHGVLIFL